MSEEKNKVVLITGGTGLVGRKITKDLLEQGYAVRYLSRSKKKVEGVTVFTWDIEKEFIEAAALEELYAIIHLSGANVGEKAWTPEWRKEILSSRTQSTALLLKELKKLDHKPRVVVCASAVGYYMGWGGGSLFDESAAKGQGFLADVTDTWEAATGGFRELGIPCSQLRIGIVLSVHGGALPKIMLPVKCWVGAPLGSGAQRMSWIHLEDLARLFLFAMEQKLDGVFNAVAPEHLSNKSFMQTLRKELKKGNIAPPVPALALRLAMGERAGLLLEDLAVSSEKVQNKGFAFKFPKLREALSDLITRSI